jgi:nitrate reductase gamma subunit
VGAVAMILPAKSIMCMPCHAATFSVGDTVTIIALIVFLLGILGLTTVWLSGSLSGEKDSGFVVKVWNLCKGVLRTIFSSRVFSIVKVLFLDALLQRSLFGQSRVRWIIHALIFYPFVFRFSWGLIALISSLWIPQWEGVRNMLDKNFLAGAFLFDLSGVMVISGILCAIVRGMLRRSQRPPGLPTQDWIAQGLMIGIIIFGFVLEGMRIAMTGTPPGSEYAFLGYSISRLFTGFSDLTGIYGYVWYAHAIITGAFVAYLPFSRMLHIILAPVSLALNAASQHKD